MHKFIMFTLQKMNLPEMEKESDYFVTCWRKIYCFVEMQAGTGEVGGRKRGLWSGEQGTGSDGHG